MQLKIYDILASLIPGTLVVGVFILSFFQVPSNTEGQNSAVDLLANFSGITTTIFLTTSYLTGYLIHALGSWIEPILWLTWRGRPSELLLNNKTNRLGMVFYDEILDYLMQQLKTEKQKNELTGKDYKQLFQVAKNKAFLHAGGKLEERLTEFNNSYIFSRNILVASLTAFIAFSFSRFIPIIHWSYWLVSTLVLLVLWYRSRDKAIYYSREILTIAYSNSTKK